MSAQPHLSKKLTFESLEARYLLSFTEISAGTLGLPDFPSQNGPYWIDYNNDGWVDVASDRGLYQNTGGTFTHVPDGPIVGDAGQGSYVGDFNNDGFLDIHYNHHGCCPTFLINQAGSGKFESFDLALPPVVEGYGGTASMGSALGDFNSDGWLDVYIGGYEHWPDREYPDRLLLSRPDPSQPGGRTFEITWEQSTILRARGVTAADFNEDGHNDIYVSNYRLQGNLLWVNDGSGSDFPFTFGSVDYNALGGHGHSIGSAFGDLDSDGHLDIFAGNFSHAGQPETQILQNQGPAGNYHFSNLGTRGIPWKESWSSPALADFDNDGMLDAFFSALGSYGNNSSLFRNTGTLGNPNFSEVGLPTSVDGYIVSWADWDGDGDLDLATDSRYFRNDNNNSNSWLKVALRAPDVEGINGAAIGAIARIKAGDLTVTRQVESGTGQGNLNELTLHFGLGNHSAPVEIEVSWPDGSTQTVTTEVNQLVTVIHGDGLPPTFHQNLVDIGEVGIVDTLTHHSQTVLLTRHYNNPVVFIQPLSYKGTDPSVTRIHNIQSDRFDVFIAEPSNANGMHSVPETASYLVFEAGIYALADGTRLEIGTIETSATAGPLIPNQWEFKTYDTTFTSKPVVFSQVQTHSGSDYLSTRHLQTTNTFFVFGLEQEEAANHAHTGETVGYLAIEPGSGTWSGMPYETEAIGNSVTQDWYDLSFPSNFADSRVSFLGSLTTYYGVDSAHLRYQQLTSGGVQLKIEEDTSLDSEMLHSTEEVSYLAIGGQGILQAQRPETAIGEVQRLTNLTHHPQVIPLNRLYHQPVVFAQSASTFGSDPVTVRISNVQPDQFTIQLTEPSNRNGTHNTPETVTCFILEAGSHQLSDGTRLEVGTLSTDATVGQQINKEWATVQLATTFNSPPVVLSQIQTMSPGGQDYLQTRQNMIPTPNAPTATEVWDMEFTGDGNPWNVGFHGHVVNGSTFNIDAKFSSSGSVPGWMTANGNPTGHFSKSEEEQLTKAGGWTAEWHLVVENTGTGQAVNVRDDTNRVSVWYDEPTNTVTLEDDMVPTEGNPERVSVTVNLDHYAAHTYRLVRQPASPTIDLHIDNSIFPVASITPRRATGSLQKVVFAFSDLNAAWDFFHYRSGANPLALSHNSFTVALESEQASSEQHVPEQIGYLAIEPGTGTWNSMAFEANVTPTHVTEHWYDLQFAKQYGDTPGFLSSLASYNGTDNAHIGNNALDSHGVQLRIDEDTTVDSEIAHTAERVAYLAIEGAGTLTAITPQSDIGEVGRIDALTHERQTIPLQRNYLNPVVFAQSASDKGTDPVAVRVTDVQSNRFTIYLAEPSNLNNIHNAAETVTYVVLEAGSHDILNDAKIEVGTVATNKTVGKRLTNQTETVMFSQPLLDPVVFSQIQTDFGNDYLQTRHIHVNPTSVELALEQEEGITEPHGITETVGYLAIESGHGAWTGLPFEVFNTPAIVTDRWQSIDFSGRYLPSPPNLLSSLTTYHGADNAHLRYANLNDSSVQFRIAEDLTRDTELAHGPESVSYLVIGGDGILTAARSAQFTWTKNQDGNWNTAANWSPRQVPNSAAQSVHFSDAIGSSSHVTTEMAITLHHVTFDHDHSYVVDGTGSISLQPSTNKAPTTTGVSVKQGSHQFQVPLYFQADAELNIASGSILTYANELHFHGHTITKLGAGSLSLANGPFSTTNGTLEIRQGALSGNGTIGGNVVNDATLSPGHEPNTMFTYAHHPPGEQPEYASSPNDAASYPVLTMDAGSAATTIYTSLAGGLQSIHSQQSALAVTARTATDVPGKTVWPEAATSSRLYAACGRANCHFEPITHTAQEDPTGPEQKKHLKRDNTWPGFFF